MRERTAATERTVSPRMRDLLADLRLGLAFGSLPWLFYGPGVGYLLYYPTHALQALQLMGCGVAATVLIAGGFVLFPGRGGPR